MTSGHTEDSLRQLLDEAGALPYGDAREALLEDVLRHAEAAELTRVAFDTRMHLINAYTSGLSRAKLFVPFARCLADYDRNPAEYEPWVSHLLLWSFKYAVGSMTRFPEVPLAQVHSALDDMERRYRAGGHSMHSVYMYRQLVAHHVGDVDAAESWYQKWCATPRDELSDCIGCEPTSKVFYLSATGRDAEAIRIAEPVLGEQLTCREQPQAILTELLLSYARTGKAEQARNAHRRAYRVLRVLPQDMGSIGDHLVFCALTGNEARGLELLDRHIGWLDRAPSPSDGMTFSASAALLLRRVVDAGHDTMPIRRPAHGDRPAAEVPAAELLAELTAHALAVAARFDKRNGTTHQTQRIRALMAAEPVADHIPLSATPPRREPQAKPRPVTEWQGLSAAEIVDRAESHLLRLEEPAAAAALEQLDRVTDADPVLNGRIAVVRARLTEGDAAESGLRDAAELFAAGGDEDRRQSVRSRLGALLCQADRQAEGMPLLRGSVEHFRAKGDEEHETWTSLRLMQALLVAGEHDEAVQLVERAAELAEDSDNPLLVGAVNWARIDSAAPGDVDGALGAATAALAAYEEAAVPRMRAVVQHRLSALWRMKGDADRAVAASEASVRLLPADSPAELRASLLLAHGELLTRVGRAAEAIPDLADAVGMATDVGQQHLAAACRRALAAAYRDAGQPLDAADLAEEAVTAFDAVADPRSADGCRYLLAGIQLDMDQPTQALALYDEIVERSEERGELEGVAQLLVETADLLDRQDRDALAAERYRRAAEVSLAVRDLDQVAYCRYQEALSLLWCGRNEEALAALEVAEQAVDDLPDDDPAQKSWHRAQLDGNAVRILRANNSLAEATTRAASALANFEAIGADQRIPGAQLVYGQVLLEAGHPAEAEPHLRAAHTSLTQNGHQSPGATAALAEALDQLGRTDEAAELRATADDEAS